MRLVRALVLSLVTLVIFHAPASAQQQYDPGGKAKVSVYRSTWNFEWQYTGVLSDGTLTTVHASCGTGLRNYVTDLDWSSLATTTAVTLSLDDNATPIWVNDIAAGASGRTFRWSVPKKGTAATAINVQLSGAPTGAVTVNASGYCGP